jgi:hypothetical protein
MTRAAPRWVSAAIAAAWLALPTTAARADHPFKFSDGKEEETLQFAVFGTTGYGAIVQKGAKEEVVMLGAGVMAQYYTPELSLIGNLWGVEYQFTEVAGHLNGDRGLPLMRHNLGLRVMWGLEHLHGGLIVGWQFDDDSRKPDGESKRVPKLGGSVEIHTGPLYHRYTYMVDINGGTSVFSGQFSWGVVF